MLPVFNDRVTSQLLLAVSKYNSDKQRALIDLMQLVAKCEYEPTRKAAMQNLIVEMSATDSE